MSASSFPLSTFSEYSWNMKVTVGVLTILTKESCIRPVCNLWPKVFKFYLPVLNEVYDKKIDLSGLVNVLAFLLIFSCHVFSQSYASFSVISLFYCCRNGRYSVPYPCSHLNRRRFLLTTLVIFMR